MATITCPFCQYQVKPTAVQCPSCGLTFQRWIEANPGKTIEGWTPPSQPAPSAAPQPAAPEAPPGEAEPPAPPAAAPAPAASAAAVPAAAAPPTPAVISVPPAPADPASPAAQRTPPPGMKPELDPKAKALIDLYKAEAGFRKNRGGADVAPGRAGIVLIAMVITNFFFGLVLATQRFPGDGLAFVSAFAGGSAFLVCAVGALQARRQFVIAGIVLAVVDLAICASVLAKLQPALRNALGFKFVLLAYLAKLLMDIG